MKHSLAKSCVLLAFLYSLILAGGSILALVLPMQGSFYLDGRGFTLFTIVLFSPTVLLTGMVALVLDSQWSQPQLVTGNKARMALFVGSVIPVMVFLAYVVFRKLSD